MNATKITVPSNVATAIAHYVALADTKTEALTDILSLGYESERSKLILCYFDGNYDELMEALVCGYDVEQTPEEKVLEYFVNLQGYDQDEYNAGVTDGVIDTLNILGIKIAGVNA